MISPEKLSTVADLIGFAASGALTYQAVRLVRHLRAVHKLRLAGASTSNSKAAELAERGAEALEKTVTRWDALDQALVIAGAAGLTMSFFLKLVALLLQP